MFGYVGVNEKELKVKELSRYQGYYCGVCHSLKERYQAVGQLTLSYDITFLALLLTGLYEPDTKEDKRRCLLHPIQKRPCITNCYTRYAADMNVLLSYYKCVDDWEDEKKVFKGLYALLLKGREKRVAEAYEKKAQSIAHQLKELHTFEQEARIKPETVTVEAALKNMDQAASYFGAIMGELFCYRDDEWSACLRRLGFFLGKYISLLDAYEDMERDTKTKNYNPVLTLYHCYGETKEQGASITYQEEFEKKMKLIFTQIMAECAKVFEQLPILEEVAILRNILYSGVWTRYVMVSEKRYQKYLEQEEKRSRT